MTHTDPLAAKRNRLEAALAAAEDRLAAYIGARDFDDGCICDQCVDAISRRLAAADELLRTAREETR